MTCRTTTNDYNEIKEGKVLGKGFGVREGYIYMIRVRNYCKRINQEKDKNNKKRKIIFAMTRAKIIEICQQDGISIVIYGRLFHLNKIATQNT